METCTRCNGEGLTGQGAEPWLKQGKVETCTDCKGTGKVSDAAEAAEAAPAEVPAPVETPVDNAGADAPVPKDETSSTGSEEAAPAAEPVVASDPTEPDPAL